MRAFRVMIEPCHISDKKEETYKFMGVPYAPHFFVRRAQFYVQNRQQKKGWAQNFPKIN